MTPRQQWIAQAVDKHRAMILEAERWRGPSADGLYRMGSAPISEGAL